MPSLSSRPQADRTESVHPALNSAVTSIPVTPGVHSTGQSAYFQNGHSTSPSDLAAGAKTAEEVLQRLARPNGDSTQNANLVDVDPKAAHPNLDLSGGVISATTAVPYTVSYSPGSDWVSGR